MNKINSEKALEVSAVCGKCGNTLSLHGLVSEVTADVFKRIINKSEIPVVVDFWAQWCGPCKKYGPEFERASKENLKTVFLKVNTDEESALSSEFKIHGIPCTVILKNGKEVKRQSGTMSQQQISEFCKV